MPGKAAFASIEQIEFVSPVTDRQPMDAISHRYHLVIRRHGLDLLVIGEFPNSNRSLSGSSSIWNMSDLLLRGSRKSPRETSVAF